MISKKSRTLVLAAAMLSASSLCAMAQIGAPQSAPPPPGAAAPGAPGATSQAQVCQRLEQQLATVDRGGSNDPAKAEQIRRFEEQAAQQQAELDRMVQQARRMNCDSTGFFDLFKGGPNAQCAPLNSKISQMRNNMDRINNDLQRMQRTGVDYERDGQRRAVITALARNECGPQYKQAAASPPAQGRNLFEQLFNPNSSGGFQPDAPGNSFRTVCVRTCDGYFFPISYSTSPSRFADDARTCQRMCPASEALLYTHRNPGEDMNQATSAGGRLYTELPNAFKFRTEFNAACSCKKQGETWAEALKGTEDRSTIEQGDIVVTDERAKQMNAPRDAKGRPILPPKGGKPDPKATAAQGTAPAPAAEEPASDAPKPPIRTVGPQLGPVR
jgi:hypothetical protein